MPYVHSSASQEYREFYPLMRAPWSLRRGLGATSPAPIVQTLTGGAGLATSALALIPATGPFAPFAAIGVGLFSLFSNVFGLGSGCGSSCIIATQAANKAVAYLQQNLAAYQASGHTKSEQLTALQIFDATWTDLVQACGQRSLGSAGQRCISERQRNGASNWCCASPTSTRVADSACNKSPCCTGCDMFVTLRDPIANDPHVVPDAASLSTYPVSGSGPSTATPGTSASTGLSAWLIPGALAGLGLLLFVGSRN